MKKIKEKLNRELKDAYEYLEEWELEKVNEIQEENGLRKLDDGKDLYMEIMNWDLSEGCDNSIYQAGYISGIKRALEIIKGGE